MIQMNRLEGFYWVARSGGYARAARAFPYPITQPAVHQQVRKLEADLGVALFEAAGRRGVRLSPAGRRLYEFTAPFFDGLPAVVRSLRARDYGGDLRIHAAGLIVRHLLPPWLKRLQRRRPDIRLDVRELEVADLSLLREGKTDLIVDHLPEVPDDIATARVGTVRAFLVVPQSHRLARRKRIDLHDLRRDTFVSYHSGLLHHALQMKALAGHGITPRQVISAGSADAILGFVASGLGYSLVPALEVRGPRAPGVIARPLTTPRVEFAVLAAWRKDADDPLVAAALAAAPLAPARSPAR